MTVSEIRRRINRLKRKFAREVAIIKLRRIAESVSNDWDIDRPPNPAAVIKRVVNAGFRLSTYGRLRQYLDATIREADVPLARSIVLNLLPWAWDHRYDQFFRWDLPPERPRSPAFANLG